MSYVDHARRHAAGGSDEIPGLAGGGTDWMLLERQSTITVAAGGTQTYLDMDPALNSHFYTNNSSLFSTALGSGALAAIHGFTVAENGVYKITWVFELSLATDGHHITGYYVGDIGVRSFFLDGYSDLLYAGSTQQGSYIHFTELMFVGGALGVETLPAGPEIAYVQDADGSSFKVRPCVLVERLSDTYDSL